MERAVVHLVIGPAGVGKTNRLVEQFHRIAAEPGSGMWLGPTRRALEQVRERIATDRACLQPQLFTFLDLAGEIIRAEAPTTRPLSEPQRRLLIEGVVADLHTRGHVHHFGGVVETRGFGEAVFELLAELNAAGVAPEQMRQLARGPLDPRKTSEVARISARYHERLRRLERVDREGQLWLARELLHQGRRGPFARLRAVFVDGFVDFAPAEQAILEALAAGVQELWLALPGEAGDEREELFRVSRDVRMRWERFAPRLEYLGVSTRHDGYLPLDFPEDESTLPAGLRHLERELFRPLRQVHRSTDATGVVMIEAPGLLGEVRLVARRIKSLLLAGTRPADILVAVREIVPYADVVREVFAEFGIPVDVEGAEPLMRQPIVATLLRALRLPDEDWSFGPVTTLLRSGYFRPEWSEIQADPEVAAHAEALLRLLGEPRRREHYLTAVERWADDPPAGLEDEQAEESRRVRMHELAVRCRAFLHRFFDAWNAAPQQVSLRDHVAWMRRLANDLGFPRAAAERPADAAALRRFFDEVRQWEELHASRGRLARREFLRRLGVLAATAGMARTPRGPERVRVLSAELASGLEVRHLFVMGLGERNFPRLAVSEPLFDASERLALRQQGLALANLGDRMPPEMLLFYRLVTRAREQLVLSYPAVDDKGQALLPCSFLSLVRDCFTEEAIPVERRRMLIERYDQDVPLSAPEARVRVAQALASGPLPRRQELRDSLPEDMLANLGDAAEIARLRFHTRDHNPYDGLFRDPGVIAEVGQLLGPEKVFSPTALEDYITCPFRFYLRHVLKLEELQEPREEIEVTRRGQAFHRALARLHQGLLERGVHEPVAEVDEHIRQQLQEAVNEYVARAPSPASKMLWQLEGERLAKAGARYRSQWQTFIEPWRKSGPTPRPHLFEVDFGLPSADGATPFGPLVIRTDMLEVRISGRIDRVDVVDLEGQLGFWIIDYKTGRGTNYTSSDLRQFRRLQLTLYALAVEQVLLAEQGARPLGLAYWLVSEKGPRVVLPPKDKQAWYRDEQHWHTVRSQLQEWVGTLISHVRRGAFPLQPRDEHCTQTCEFATICRISQARSVEKAWDLPLPTPAGEGRSADEDSPC